MVKTGRAAAKDGLFSTKLLWKRAPYKSEEDKVFVQERIQKAVAEARGT